jgi:hypothetical protein
MYFTTEQEELTIDSTQSQPEKCSDCLSGRSDRFTEPEPYFRIGCAHTLVWFA